jgi:hypothetical protein
MFGGLAVLGWRASQGEAPAAHPRYGPLVDKGGSVAAPGFQLSDRLVAGEADEGRRADARASSTAMGAIPASTRQEDGA